MGGSRSGYEGWRDVGDGFETIVCHGGGDGVADQGFRENV